MFVTEEFIWESLTPAQRTAIWTGRGISMLDPTFRESMTESGIAIRFDSLIELGRQVGLKKFERLPEHVCAKLKIVN